ncbi:hypothetical protein [Nannocystis punicea]|uniref:DUF4375 domain-containing protein n=1 Tax=Nannocystis punicea TaxID=2995304 RepID=A0ABY7HBE2_9BACT|nr:hypothetical protein [Nannocystis poenicansa]WAS96596.1 hypothetical protein O0S08_10600 [Nannocystis poenicansa]
MISISGNQLHALRRVSLDEFAEEAEQFLRRHFESRLRRTTSNDIREAVHLACRLGHEHAITCRSELLIYLACACVCGLFVFDDPRCAWLFHGRLDSDDVDGALHCNIGTFAENLEAAVGSGFFSEDSLAGFEEAVIAGEQRLAVQPDALERVLRTLTPARAGFMGTPQFARFLELARIDGERLRLRGRASDRHLLLGWLFGPRFVDDPLCQPAVAFLRALEAEPGGAAP